MTHTTVRRPCNHALHLVLSLFTCGLWLPVWAVLAVVGRRETVTHHGPLYPPPEWSAPQLPLAIPPEHVPGREWCVAPDGTQWYRDAVGQPWRPR